MKWGMKKEKKRKKGKKRMKRRKQTKRNFSDIFISFPFDQKGPTAIFSFLSFSLHNEE